MRSYFDPRPPFTESVGFVLTEEQKRAAYAVAAREGVPLAVFVRRALMQAVNAANNTGDRPRAA